MAKNMEIINSEFYYTGGGIWCAEGKFADGTYFWGGNDGRSFVGFDVLSALPYDEEHCAEYYDEDSDIFIRHLTPNQANQLWLKLLEIHKKEMFSSDYELLKGIKNK